MTEEALFHEALAKPPAERAAFLDAACAEQPELRAAVEALLAAHEASGNLLDKPAADQAQTVDSEAGAEADGSGEYTPQPDEGPPHCGATRDYRSNIEPGAVIAGRYTLQERIGEGGMGEVWVAKQTEPIKRKVALKLIKVGMDSKAVLARFEQERQALAMMDHPNIARVLDGGIDLITEPRPSGSGAPRPLADVRGSETRGSGQPFFVMELVNGLPLTKFCDEAKLTPKERLELFVPICQAVQHAHQKGIIHRDLKPANILITLIDGRPAPKVIDFGVAKATAGRLTEESLSTQFGAVVGTLEYMSPEQASFSGVDIDTRADIYSLGVILYELLTGLRPIDAARLKKAALTEMIRIIQEEEPSKPSTRLSTDASLPSLAALRKTEPKKLMALLRGELDWLVLKCLEKQRDRRYQTANELARDIQRYLADEPVEARPPSLGYRAKKFLRRNKGAVSATAALLLLLVIGAAVSTWQAFRATKAEILASKRLTQVQQALKESEERRGQAQEVSDFLISVFRGADPWDRRRKLTMEEMLEQARSRLPYAFEDNPGIKADLLDALGQTFTNAGLQNDGVKLLRKAHAIRLRELGENDPRTIRSQGNLAFALYMKGDLDESIKLSQSALKRGRSQWRDNDPNSPIPQFLDELALMLTAKRKPQQALPLCREALELCRAAKGPDHPDTAMAMWHLARAYNNTGKPDEALPLAKASAEILERKFDESHPQCIAARHFYAMALGRTKQWGKAVVLLEQLYKRNQERFGPTNLITLEYAITELSQGYLNTHQYKKLIRLVEPAVKQYADRRGPHHFVTINGSALLAVAHANEGDFPTALALCHKTLNEVKEKYGADSQLMRKIGEFLFLTFPVSGQGALEFNRNNLKQTEELLGPDHIIAFFATMDLADAYSHTDRYAEAEPAIKLALQRARRHLPADHRWLQTALRWLAKNQLGQKKHGSAEFPLRELLSLREKAQPDSWQTFNTKSMLGGALLGQKKYAEAEPLLLAGYQGLKKLEQVIPPQKAACISEAVERLVRLYDGMQKKAEAAKWRKKLETIRAAAKPSKKKP